MADLIAACKRSKITQALEAGLIGYITLFKYVITFLSVDTLKDLIHVRFVPVFCINYISLNIQKRIIKVFH